MTDYFALLQEPRRPWLDPDHLKQRFLSLSSGVHPDRVHGADAAQRRSAQERYTELNQAYTQLRHPKERLRHLLELETGNKPQQVQEVPPDLMNLFFEVGQLCKQTDALLTEKRATTSPLLQVQILERGQLWSDRLNALGQKLNSRQQELTKELKELDLRWVALSDSSSATRTEILVRLEELYRWFSYFARWEEQIQERIVQLSL